jgi:anaerobic ribonucleoside-triphosphate reductase activating protein
MMFLNIANMVAKTNALGPGIRAVIWVQGCKLHCPGCIAPGWLPFKPSIQLTPQEVVDKLVSDDINGLTFSGGEPMEQAEALAEVAHLARKRKDLDIICFTGYRYQTLRYRPPNPGVARLLSFVDVLIDGPYIQSLNDSHGLRGSTNQRIIHLTNRLKRFPLEDQTRQVELKIEDGALTLVGIPTPKVTAALDHLINGKSIPD